MWPNCHALFSTMYSIKDLRLNYLKVSSGTEILKVAIMTIKNDKPNINIESKTLTDLLKSSNCLGLKE